MASQPEKKQRFRIQGSGYTVFSYNGSKLKFCTQIADAHPTAVANPVPIRPLDERHPIEIAFPAAAGAGTLTVTIYEEWEFDVWRQFPGYDSGEINDIIDIFRIGAEIGGVTCMKIITPPPPYKRRTVQYHGAVITMVDMGETITIDAMVPGKTVTITYTHTTRKGG